jgi:hypothetical protein
VLSIWEFLIFSASWCGISICHLVGGSSPSFFFFLFKKNLKESARIFFLFILNVKIKLLKDLYKNYLKTETKINIILDES